MKNRIQFIATFLFLVFISPTQSEAVSSKKYYCIQAKVSRMNLSSNQSKALNKSVFQKAGNTTANHWAFISAGKGYYYIRSKNNALFLTASPGGRLSKSVVKQSRFNGKDSQKWKLIKAGGEYYFLKNKFTKLFLDVKGGSKKNNAQIIQYRLNRTDAQKWRFLAIGGGVHKIERIVHAALFGSSYSGANIFNHKFSFRQATSTYFDQKTKQKTVNGYFSHDLTARADDHYYFTAVFSQTGKLVSYNCRIKRGGFGKLPSTVILNHKRQRFPVNAKGLNLRPNKVRNLRTKAETRLYKRDTWERAAKELALIISYAAIGN